MVEVVKGERLIIHGMPFEARVALVEPIDGDGLLIHLIWPGHGTSRVYGHDYKNTWVKYSEVS